MLINRLVEPGIGKRLRDERKRLNLTQDEMAQKLGVSKGTYFQYEKEMSFLNIGVLKSLEDNGVDAYFVLNGGRNLSSFEESSAEELSVEEVISAADLRRAFARLIGHVAEGSGSIDAASLDSILTGILLSQVSVGSQSRLEKSHGPHMARSPGVAG